MSNRPERPLINENTVSVATALIAFAVYRTTVCPTVSFTDSGELATVASTLGIAHPTGYPLWTLLGRIAASIPLGSEEIVRLNGLSGIVSAIAVGLFLKLVIVVLRSRQVFRLTSDAGDLLRTPAALLCLSSSALVFGFSSTVWAQSVEIEVYALHLLLVLAASMLFVQGIEEQLTDRKRFSRPLFLFAYVLGLSFANHMTTILLAPAFLYLFFASLGFNRNSWKVILALVPFFLLGISLYLFLPIRSADGPLMDWGHPATLQRLWWHVTGKQYQSWMFAGWPVIEKQLRYVVTNFPTEFHWVLVAFLAFGVVKTFVLSRRLFAFTLTLLVTCLAYSVNYDINEIDPYFILAYVACGVFIGIGVLQFVRWLRRQPGGAVRIASVLLLVALPAVQVLNNRHDVDQSRNYQADDFVKNVFLDVEPRAVVFSSLWDYFVSPAYYVQFVRKERPDIIIVDRDLLQNRTWYFRQFSRQYPGILERSKDKAEAFLAELTKWEQGEMFDYYQIKARWDALLEDMIQKLITDHPIYVDPRIAGEFPQNFEGIPQGYMIRLLRKGERAPWKPIGVEPRGGGFSNYVSEDLTKYIAAMYTYHALWLSTNGQKGEARDAVGKALRIDPGFIPALRLQAQIR